MLQRAFEFRRLLNRRIFVSDGAMGTSLYARGTSMDRCFDELNLTSPNMVDEIHRQYVAAGAEILETNTFGANRARLNTFGLADKLEEINLAGVALAREAAEGRKQRPFVAGAMGPLGTRFPLTDARAIFREQAEYLCQAGVDLLMLETFTDLGELSEATLAAREAAGPEPVIVALVAVGDSGNVIGGATVEEFARQANGWPIDVIGFNCSVGPKSTLDALKAVAPHSEKPLCAIPNAGLPECVEGRQIYPCSPELMAQYARRMVQAGAKIIGGCCGTTPEHIKRMVPEVRSVQPL